MGRKVYTTLRKAIVVNPAEQGEVAELRAQIAEYERVFKSAAPRLAAFRRLEEIAREQRVTPEAIAAEAAIDLLERERKALTEQVGKLEQARDELEKDVVIMLNKKKAEVEIIDDLKIENHDIHMEVGAILDELASLREDTVRLMSERSDLELHVRALRLELAHLEKGRAQLRGHSGPVDEAAAVPGKFSGQFELASSEEADESERFDKFFHAKVEHDKARDWILG